MKPADYDAWYDSPRGRWIGNAEYRLLSNEMDLKSESQLLDVGCGTGWFARRFAMLPCMQVTGIDVNAEWLAFARSRDVHSTSVQADALALPFADNSFDHVLSVATLCFTTDWHKAVGEIVRVSRKDFAIGLLNRHSLLWRDKGRQRDSGAYRGASGCRLMSFKTASRHSRLPMSECVVRSICQQALSPPEP